MLLGPLFDRFIDGSPLGGDANGHPGFGATEFPGKRSLPDCPEFPSWCQMAVGVTTDSSDTSSTPYSTSASRAYSSAMYLK